VDGWPSTELIVIFDHHPLMQVFFLVFRHNEGGEYGQDDNPIIHSTTYDLMANIGLYVQLG
jgi:hypothetical protein